MRIDVPENDRLTLRTYLIPREGQDAIWPVLDEGSPSPGRLSLASTLAAGLKLDEESARQLADSLISMAQTIERADIHERENVIEAIAASIVAPDSDVRVRAEVHDRIKRVARSQNIVTATKSINVSRDSANTFCTARTLSEIRPVFAGEPLSIAAAAVLHQLKIVYHTGPKRAREELFVVCDRTDLLALRQVVERALEKDALLTTAVTAMKWPPVS